MFPFVAVIPAGHKMRSAAFHWISLKDMILNVLAPIVAGRFFDTLGDLRTKYQKLLLSPMKTTTNRAVYCTWNRQC